MAEKGKRPIKAAKQVVGTITKAINSVSWMYVYNIAIDLINYYYQTYEA